MNAQRFPAAAFTLLPVLAAACALAQAAAPQTPSAAEHSQQNVLAELALQRGDCRTAAQNFAAGSQGASVTQARRATEVAFDCEQVFPAYTAAQNWLQAAPHDRQVSIVYAAAALRLYKVPEARAALGTALKASPPMADAAFIGLTQALVQQADANAAFAALNGLADGPSASAPMLTMMAQLALQAYDFGRAEALMRQVLQKEPGRLESLRLKERLAILRGDAAAALATAREVMKASPEDGEFELVEVYVALNRPEDARRELERMRVTGVDDAAIDRRLAVLDLDSGKLESAQKRFVSLLDRGEAGDNALLLLAQITARLGDRTTALSLYRQLLESPLAEQARVDVAGLLMQQGKRADALAMLDTQADKSAHGTFQLLLDKAHLLADHGDPEGALLLLTAGLQSYPNHPTLEYELATLQERAGHIPESLRTFEQLLTERPDDPTVLNALGYTLADHSQQLPRAEQLIRKALAVTPDSPSALDSLGWVRLRRGEAREAAGILEKAYALGQDADIAAHWGEALWMSGAKPQALKVWNEAKSRHPDSPVLTSTLKRLAPTRKQ